MTSPILKRLAARWYAWPEWYAYRDRVSSWFSNWLVANCVVNYAIGKLTGFAPYSAATIWRRDGLRLRLPIDKLDEGPSWAFVGDEYIAELISNYPEFTMSNGDIAIDVGAHVGTFSLALIHRFGKIRAVALEPSLNNLRLFRENARINGLDESKLLIKPLGLFDTEGVQSFAIGSSSTTGSIAELSVYKEKDGTRKAFAAGETVQISCTTLNALFAEMGANSRCRLLKIDCEGSEYRSMKAADLSLWTRVDYMIIEAHPCAEGAPHELRNWIVDQGYDVKVKELGNGCLEFYCRHK